MKLKKKTLLFLLLIIAILLVTVVISYGYHIFKPTTGVENEKTASELLEEQGIHLVSQESFVSDANKLLEKGYSATEINHIYEYMSTKNILAILENDYVDLSEFYQISNFDFHNLARYQAYQFVENLEMKDVVTRVNLNLDQEFYSTIHIVDNPSSITVLVNKYNALPSDYVPDDLVPIPSFPNLKIKDDAVNDFENLLAAATMDGMSLIPYSTYRSYDYQSGLYNKYLQTDPQSVVDTYSARPGHSEHQTGLAIDIRSSSHWYNLTDSDYEWMLNNSYKYGFIVRYPKNNSTITGYQEEPWHIRYVGIDIATQVHELGITYDEFYDLYLTEY